MALGFIVSTNGIEITCEFPTEYWSFRLKRNLTTCVIENQPIAESGSTVKSYLNENAEGIKMQNNKEVKNIPENLAASIPNVKAVDFEGCAISSIGDQFKGLQELEVLSLPKNQIDTIASDALADNLNLKELYLWRNKLTYVNDQHFKSTKNLIILDLSYNEIASIDPSAFKNLNKLTQLDLYHNKLTCIDAKMFHGVTRVEELNFKGNKIEYIETGTFAGLKSLKMVFLSENICILGDYDRQHHNADDFSTMMIDLKKCSEIKLSTVSSASPAVGWNRLFFLICTSLVFVYSKCNSS